MDIFSCWTLCVDDRATQPVNELKQALLKACEQVHSDYIHSVTERSVALYYKYNGPSTYASLMKDLSKRKTLSAISAPLKALSQMYMEIGLQGFAGIIIHHDNTSIVIHNQGNVRRSIPLYCSIEMSKVVQKVA
jgi:hypothetical protein